ncbi:hypothetical protein E8E11_009290 [Didymella keratinophila]|nr:hypothetical protein E8E11_009290 [Didymella keratinophila]
MDWLRAADGLKAAVEVEKFRKRLRAIDARKLYEARLEAPRPRHQQLDKDIEVYRESKSTISILCSGLLRAALKFRSLENHIRYLRDEEDSHRMAYRRSWMEVSTDQLLETLPRDLTDMIFEAVTSDWNLAYTESDAYIVSSSFQKICEPKQVTNKVIYGEVYIELAEGLVQQWYRSRTCIPVASMAPPTR